MASILNLLDTPEPPNITMKARAGTKSIAELNKKVDAVFASSEAPRFTRELSRAAVLLWHDHFDAAHEIAQDIENANGSFIHGVLHRREPDFMNARYWFRRVGSHHPSFDCIVGKIKVALLTIPNMEMTAQQLAPNDKWDPLKFIDFLEDNETRHHSQNYDNFIRQVQAAEIHCFLLSLPNH
jgi:hypothetical protein